MPYADIIQQRTAQRDHLNKKKLKNPQWYQELQKRNTQKRESIYSIVNHIKSTVGCLTCDEKDHEKLQFHHVLPEFKESTVSKLISNRSKLITVLKEIDKCVCVCTACHKQLDKNIYFVICSLKTEKWRNDWGLNEALEWFSKHPQSGSNKRNFLNIIKAVIRNIQMQDLKKFKDVIGQSQKG